MMAEKIKTFPLNREKAPAVPQGTDWRSWNNGANTAVFGLMIPKGVYIIDLDTYKGITKEQVEATIGCKMPWADAELQRTMKKGVHFGFRVPKDADLTNGTDIAGLSGFDTRASGKGYIATGEGYEDLTPFGILETLANPELLPELPDEAVAFFATGRKHGGGDDDLLATISAEPLDFTAEQVEAYMSRLTSDHAQSSKDWLTVMFGLYHQTQGSEEGWQLFDKFSRLAPEKYNQRENRKRWESVGRSSRAEPVTFASVVAMCGGRSELSVAQGGFFDSLLEKAAEVESRESYAAFKKTVQALSDIELGPDLRGMLAGELHINYGKSVGMTKTDIKKALMPPRKGRDAILAGSGRSDGPEWLNDWCYLERPCEFANKELGYSIKQEAFNAKYSRMIDCVAAERSAAQIALINYGIPTYVDTLFWPGAGEVVEQDGKLYLNSYKAPSLVPADRLNDSGAAAVKRMLDHVGLILKDTYDQTILLDWLTYVYQNPGKRVNWSVLLQGGYGTGKSYFASLMQAMMGSLVTNLEPSAIGGRFTGWAHGSLLVVIEEIRVSGMNKYEVMDRLKPFITNDTIQIEEKGRDHRTVPNFTSYLMLTNHKDALPIKDGDRRHCILFSHIQTERQLFDVMGGSAASADYFDRLFSDLREYPEALAHFFTNREISPGFNAQGRAPDTKAKRVMLSAADSPEQSDLVDLIESHACEVISDSILDVTWLRKQAEGNGDQLPHQRAMAAILLEMGYEPIGKVKITKTRTNHRVWIDPTMVSEEDAKKLIRDYFDDPNYCPF